ncbi:hypothetical protein NPIL_214041 [Nephila pilipes]|uniref:Uncharacterized protein n=1 Tax=Nephila pilipes TaxID=299642 RepID=A0A8X6TVJ0_NEPPI|nr:hypothetical protein NPIL_214041 [Nephila pilipes]
MFPSRKIYGGFTPLLAPPDYRLSVLRFHRVNLIRVPGFNTLDIWRTGFNCKGADSEGLKINTVMAAEANPNYSRRDLYVAFRRSIEKNAAKIKEWQATGLEKCSSYEKLTNSEYQMKRRKTKPKVKFSRWRRENSPADSGHHLAIDNDASVLGLSDC